MENLCFFPSPPPAQGETLKSIADPFFVPDGSTYIYIVEIVELSSCIPPLSQVKGEIFNLVGNPQASQVGTYFLPD